MTGRAAAQIVLALIGVSFFTSIRACSRSRTPVYSTAVAGTQASTLPNPASEYRYDGLYYFHRTGYSSSSYSGGSSSGGSSSFWGSGSSSSGSSSSWGSSSGGSSSVSRGGFGSSSSSSS